MRQGSKVTDAQGLLVVMVRGNCRISKKGFLIQLHALFHERLGVQAPGAGVGDGVKACGTVQSHQTCCSCTCRRVKPCCHGGW